MPFTRICINECGLRPIGEQAVQDTVHQHHLSSGISQPEADQSKNRGDAHVRS